MIAGSNRKHANLGQSFVLCNEWLADFYCLRGLDSLRVLPTTRQRGSDSSHQLTMRRARTESSQSLRTHSFARTKLPARPCETNLFLLQCEGVNIVRSYVADQHRCVCRIKTHPKAERPCGTESLQIDNALRVATRYADSKHARIIRRPQEVNELAIRRPRRKIALARWLHYRSSLRLKVEDLYGSWNAGGQPGDEAAVG